MSKFFTYRSKAETVSFQIEKRSILVVVVLSVLTVLSCILGAGIGDTMIDPLEVIGTIAGVGSGEHDFVILTLRLPRIIVALLVGAGLGVAGAILQGIIRNPLASPDIIGITGGATVAAVAFITFLSGRVSVHWLPLAAITGAALISLLIYVLAWNRGVTPLRLVLIGIGLQVSMSAASTMMIVLGPFHTVNQAYIWMTGSVYGSSWNQVYTLLPWMLVLIPGVMAYARHINVQEMDDSISTGLGAAVEKQRFLVLLFSVALTGAAVAVAGAITFVGLLAPHIARRLVGRSFQVLVPVSAMIGGLIVFVADLIARTAFYPLDIPAGVFTAGVGAPFFIYLLFRYRNNW
ncbi:MAG: iron ABC transporter permease [Brevibacillus sp.]|nr:iron ABC transporter permease [Brevibacillus sp.]